MSKAISFTDEWGHTETLKNDSDQYKQWYQETIDSLKETKNLLNEDLTTWKVIAEDKANGDKVYYKDIDKRGKTFALTFVVDFDVKHVFEVSQYQQNDKPHWNPTIKEYNLLFDIGDQTSLFYWVTNEILAGLVSSRDFVDVRTYRKTGDSYIISGKGTEYSEMPPQKGRVRGLNGANFFKMSPVEGKPGSTNIIWIMSSDMKGMLPKAVVEKTMYYMMLEYAKQLRLRLAKPAIIN